MFFHYSRLVCRFHVVGRTMPYFANAHIFHNSWPCLLRLRQPSADLCCGMQKSCQPATHPPPWFFLLTHLAAPRRVHAPPPPPLPLLLPSLPTSASASVQRRGARGAWSPSWCVWRATYPKSPSRHIKRRPNVPCVFPWCSTVRRPMRVVPNSDASRARDSLHSLL